jgi:hypothetical protein
MATQIRHIRCGPVWDRALAKAQRQGTTLTAVVVAAIEAFVAEDEPSKCAWCPDYFRPSPEFHPNGSPIHLPTHLPA